MTILVQDTDTRPALPVIPDVSFRQIAEGFAPPVLPSLADMQDVAQQYTMYDQSFGQDFAYGSREWLDGQWINGRWFSAGYGPEKIALLEGRTFRVNMSPGVIGVSAHNEVKRENTLERGIVRQFIEGDLAGTWINTETGETGDVADFVEIKNRPGRRVITCWSGKSRSNMVRSLGQVDYSSWIQGQGTLAMVTLTYPNEWEKLVPTGKDFKRHYQLFVKRWERKIGAFQGIWKMEFQRRGAPHMHMLLKVPAMVKGQMFEQWLSRTWADIVGASDDIDGMDRRGEPSSEYTRHLAAGTGVDFSGDKFSDPRRISLYFLGHSAKSTDGKEYQHIVPQQWQRPQAGPGRFWGIIGLGRATVEVDLTLKEFVTVRRCLRHALKARNWVSAVVREKAQAKRAVRRSEPLQNIKARKSWTLGSKGGLNGGWVLVNDGFGFALDLSRLLGRLPEIPPAPYMVEGQKFRRPTPAYAETFPRPTGRATCASSSCSCHRYS